MTAQPAQIDRLLIVEDSRADALAVRHCLATSASPYQIEVVDCIGKALTRLLDEKFDLILLDLGLPDSTGLDTISRIIAVAPDVPVVVLTGRDDEDIGRACIDAGAQDYLCKGWMTPENLGRVISFTLRRIREAAARLVREAVQKDQVLTAAPIEALVTRKLAGEPPLRVGKPAAFAAMQATYQALLEEYMAYLSNTGPKPHERMQILITRFGDLSAAPRDLIDVHLASLEEVRRDTRKYLRLFAVSHG